jgi:hypothetical protein
MAISTGTRLGPYEIVAPVGVGGMGEVEPVWRRERAVFRRAGAARRNPERSEGSPC